MAPPAVVDVTEMDVDAPTPGEEEFATPKSSAEQVPSAEELVTASVDPIVPNTSGDKFPPQLPGDNASTLLSNASTRAPEITTLPSTVDVQTQDETIADATPTAAPPAIDQNVDTATPTVALPISSALASSLPHSHRRTTPAESHGASSSSPATAAPSKASPLANEEKELARLKEAIEGVSPIILHKWVRKSWRGLLFGPFDEDHISYILRCCMKNAPSFAVERGLREAINLPAHRQYLNKKILEKVTVDELITQVPETILDEALKKRLQLAPANDIVRWLADAERLGFKHGDVVDLEDELITEKHLPGGSRADAIMLDAPRQPAQHNPYQNSVRVTSGYKDPLLLEQERQSEIDRQNLIIRRQQQELARHNLYIPPPPVPALIPPSRHVQGHVNTDNVTPLQRTSLQRAAATGNSQNLKCSLCGFLCPTQSGFLFHNAKKICQRQPATHTWQWGCENCGQHFTTKQGQSYHLLKEVCRGGAVPDDGSLDEGTPEEHEAAIRAQLGQNSPHDTIPPPARPTFSTASRHSGPEAEPPQTQQPSRGGVQVPIPRPPMHTPVPPPSTPQSQPQRAKTKPAAIPALQDIDPTARVSPSQLSDAKRVELERQLDAEDTRYQKALAAIDPQWPVEDQERRRISLKNGNASKKSQIRKSFGVTLRMRDKDKIASQALAAASPNPTEPGPSTSRPAHSSPHIPAHVSSQTSGFSPINAPPPRNNPSPLSGSADHPPPQGGLGGRPRHNPSQNYSLTNSNDPSMTGFGVLTTQPQPHRNKRQRTSSGTDSPITATPSRAHTPHGPAPAGSGLSMMEVNSEDAAKKLPKKVPIAAAQAKWESLQPKKNGEIKLTTNSKRKASDAQVADATSSAATAGAGDAGQLSGVRPGPYFRREPIEIESSSDSEAVQLPLGAGKGKGKEAAVGGATNGGSVGLRGDEATDGVVDADKPLPSTEDTESDTAGESRPSSGGAARGGSRVRGLFTAKRGGRPA